MVPSRPLLNACRAAKLPLASLQFQPIQLLHTTRGVWVHPTPLDKAEAVAPHPHPASKEPEAHSTHIGTHPKLSGDPNSPWRELEKKSDDKETQQRRDYVLRHPVYLPEELQVDQTHRELQTVRDRLAYTLVQVMRRGFDTATKYSDVGDMTEKQWLNRIVFLETVAGVPGMVAAMQRHLRSLRLLRRDNGWVHTLLEEAENERMHLLTFMKMKQPSIPFRAMVLLTQGVFFNLFFASYMLSPRTCHRFVGYLEEEAVHTYTSCLRDMESPESSIYHWRNKPAPDIAKEYWKLDDNATMVDVIKVVRADEAEHRDVNHTLASIKPDDPNPF
ncbi:alternative oxidase-domain-containing protein [Gaertneriomyces semiglobifer]|nr:alternative oxidase-domain-containing protein [Gaertneriomyces semiglobifer]